MTRPAPEFYRSLDPVHFIGIGGIGMSALAGWMLQRGHRVQGSDLAANAQTAWLRTLGARIRIGHAAEHIKDAGLVVASSAVRDDNAEWRAAERRGLPRTRRAALLGALMQPFWTITVSGTHGKTTTTSLIAAVLEADGRAPHVINGGVMGAYGRNVKLGRSRWMVVEADESDGGFLELPSQISVLTNLDAEHLGQYQGSLARLARAFRRYAEQTAFYGCVILGSDDARLRRLGEALPDRRVRRFGFGAEADVRAARLRPQPQGMNFDLHVRTGGRARKHADWHLAAHGEHNLRNALAAVAVGLELEIPLEQMRRALKQFRGTERRFSRIGSWRGAAIYDDYAHHPTEVTAVLAAARALGKGRVRAIVQPHRYSRVQALFPAFVRALGAADEVWLLPIYAAGEKPPGGDASSEALARALRARKCAAHAVAEAELPHRLAADMRADDTLLCMGAGSISQYAHGLERALTAATRERTKAPQRVGKRA